MNGMTLLEQYIAERRALGFRFQTNEKYLRRFMKDYPESPDGKIIFTKEYVLSHIENGLNRHANTVHRYAGAINGFMDFVIRQGIQAYKIPHKYLPQEVRNFEAYIFSKEEILRILDAADHLPPYEQNPARHIQVPVMFRILFNCGLRTSELRCLRLKDVDIQNQVLTVLDTKFHKNRLVPMAATMTRRLERYIESLPDQAETALLFPSPRYQNATHEYGNSWIHTQFRELLRLADIPYRGLGKGPRPHDIRHTFAVHCLNRWVLSGEDLTAALPILSRYLGHTGLKGTQKYLQLTAQMYPDLVARMESQFGHLISCEEEKI